MRFLLFAFIIEKKSLKSKFIISKKHGKNSFKVFDL